MKIVWSETAFNTYVKILDYLTENWTKKEVEKLEKSLEKLLQNIITNNKLCPVSKLIGYRKCVVSKQTSLIYTLENTQIQLITFIDNRALHDF
jgi:addiction module RelE/StbE family toxin